MKYNLEQFKNNQKGGKYNYSSIESNNIMLKSKIIFNLNYKDRILYNAHIKKVIDAEALNNHIPTLTNIQLTELSESINIILSKHNTDTPYTNQNLPININQINYNELPHVGVEFFPQDFDNSNQYHRNGLKYINQRVDPSNIYNSIEQHYLHIHPLVIHNISLFDYLSASLIYPNNEFSTSFLKLINGFIKNTADVNTDKLSTVNNNLRYLSTIFTLQIFL